MRVLFFGTYDARRHPRVHVLKEGFEALGHEVTECNVPLGLDTAWRVRIAKQPWLLPVLAVKLGAAWARLWRRARRLLRPDVVVIGYMGHFDVHLARRLWPGGRLVLDHLIFADDTARDRGISGSGRMHIFGRLDRAALGAANVIVVDTEEHRAMVPPELRERALVVPVGASTAWFSPPLARPGPLSVIFFGLYTPLHGAITIGEAIGSLADEPQIHFTMIGRGQEFEATRRAASASARVQWLDWVETEALRRLLADADICLGIFGAGPKALRVVPNKVYQGAAAGCAVVTSDTAPQRAMLGEAAIFVHPAEPTELAEALRALAADRPRLASLRSAAYRRADEAFRPPAVVRPLEQRLSAVSS
jgi:glycosyltransferase involved in cell wall biosynthesis